MENIILIFLGEINNESLLLSKHCLVSRKSYVELQTQNTDTRKRLRGNLVSGTAWSFLFL